MTAKAPKFWHTLNQAPRSAKDNGQHWKSSPPAYGRPADRADQSAGGASPPSSNPWWNTWVAFDEPKPPTLPYAGIRTGEIIGHRLWWVVHERGEPFLCSLAHRRIWRPGETIEGDVDKIVDRDPLFRWNIWGGIYAFSSIDGLTNEANDVSEGIANLRTYRAAHGGRLTLYSFGWHPFNETETFVAGTLKIWGEVVEHETGYRAQFAKIASIDRIFGNDGDLERLRQKYLSNAEPQVG